MHSDITLYILTYMLSLMIEYKHFMMEQSELQKTFTLLQQNKLDCQTGNSSSIA